MKHLTVIILSLLAMSACASSKTLKPPKALPENWQDPPNYLANDMKPPSSENMTQRGASHMTSLWSSSPKSLFGDRRASKLGDILTVEINIDDEARFQNSVTADTTSQKNLEVSSFFGLPELVAKVLPAGASLKPAVDMSSASNMSGQGNITRQEKLTLRLAARIDAVLPNGYLHLVGRQEIIVNNELRYLQVSGVIRIADISRLNTITYDKIADAKIFYGGKGQITRAGEEKAGNKLIRKILPF